ncbi:MAG: ATP-binding protein [Thiovulaceae bacterium]|nr:ATP-binding protein [Sulfurimonadaceae bacterium]
MLRLFLWVLPLMLLSSNLFGMQKSLDLSKLQHRIGHAISFYEDPEGTLTFDTIKDIPLRQFTPINKEIHTKLFTTSTFWYHFNVDNNTKEALDRLIVFSIPWLDEINITIISKQGKLSNYQGGDNYTYDKRAVDHPFSNFEHQFEQGTSSVYIKVKTRDPFIVPISVIDKFTFLEEISDISNTTGFIYGIILAMMFYNLILFINVKIRAYAFYVTYLGAFLLAHASYNCYTFKWVFPNLPHIQNWAEASTIFLFGIAGLFFTQSFLGLKKHFPKLYTLTNKIIIGYIILMIVTYFMGYHYHIIFAITLIVFYSVYVFCVALYALLKGNHSARFFLLGITAGLLGTLITALSVMSIIPYSDIGFHAIDYGMVIDAIMLSLALADHFKIIQEDKIKAEKEAKRAQEASKAKEEFLSNMSHEIRTPMNAILGFVQILQKNTTDELNRSYLDIINSSSQTLLHVINDILDFSKIESGKMVLEDYSFNAKTELAQVSQLFEITAKKKSIRLISQISPSIPDCLVGDLTRIKQIMFNFLSNAIKFTPEEKSIYIDVNYDEVSSVLSISVEDEGIGISTQAQEKIFYAFEQADNSTTRKFGGTGLGLSIALKLAKLMNGEIRVQSEEYQGSTFTLVLPLQSCPDHKKLQLHEEEGEHSKKDTFTGEILVAEDNKTNQILIKLLLDEYQLRHTIANDGLEALEAYKKGTFRLVLMDENMPNMTGLEAFKEIRAYEQSKQLQQTPVVALTANVMEEDRKRFKEAGMNDFIAKPIDKNDFERVLKRFCKE